MISGSSKREVLTRTLSTTGFHRLLELTRAWNGLLVFNYHRIGNPQESDFDRALWSASEEEFDNQVRYLSRHFDIVGIDDLDHALSQKSGRHVMITFDDGYRDNYRSAFPILRSYNAPATFFLSTGFLDRPGIAWWDEIAWMTRNSRRTGLKANPWTIQPVPFDEPHRQQAVRRLLSTYKMVDGHETEDYLQFLAEATGSGRCPGDLASDMWMHWDMVREMQREGMSFGGHTVTHPILTNLSPEKQDYEIRECRSRIQTELGEKPVAFSYPVGKLGTFDDVTRLCLQKYNYRWAFSYYGGYHCSGRFDRYNLPRIAVETDVSFPTFRFVSNLPQFFAR